MSDVKENLIKSGWYSHLEPFFMSDDYKNITTHLGKRILENITIYPKFNNIFKAFELCHYDNIKCVILGEEPYNTPNAANGLAFGSNSQITPIPLNNLLIEVENEFDAVLHKQHMTLEGWAEQGVLLLNSTMTVESGHPYSHKDIGWDKFTHYVINLLKQKDFLVFVCFGEYNKQFIKSLDPRKYGIIQLEMPINSNFHLFRGAKSFTKVNDLLKQKNISPIDWTKVNGGDYFEDFMNKLS